MVKGAGTNREAAKGTLGSGPDLIMRGPLHTKRLTQLATLVSGPFPSFHPSLFRP
jgi:hypothetical protein